jgi:hypothetical protein
MSSLLSVNPDDKIVPDQYIRITIDRILRITRHYGIDIFDQCNSHPDPSDRKHFLCSLTINFRRIRLLLKALPGATNLPPFFL